MDSNNNRVYDGKPNPHARIGFVVFYPFHFYVYKNIFAKLRDEAEFIVDLGAYRPMRQPPQLLHDICQLLDMHDVPYRILNHDDYFFSNYLSSFFKQYEALVGVWERGCMSIKETSRIKKIDVAYGAGKELTMARPSLSIFDLVLAFGPRDAKLCSHQTNVAIVGNSKFDDWFTGTVDIGVAKDIASRLHPEKKTVLYLPTHGDLSSIDLLARDLISLSREYNVIVKMHYFTPREEPERVKLLTHNSIILCADDTDLLPLLKLADVVVSDNSSAIFDAILADKPLVVADFWDERYLDEVHREPTLLRRGPQGALTYSQSIEQVIKREGKVITLRKRDSLKEKIAEALRDEERYKSARAEIRQSTFAFNDGRCAERAAKAIVSFLVDVSATQRPIMFHVFESFKRRIGILSYAKERELNRKVAEYQAFLSKSEVENGEGVLFSIILFGDLRGSGLLSLRALLDQSFPTERYEIILPDVSGNQMSAALSEMPAMKSERPSVVPGRGGNFSERIERALSIVRGQYVCFTISDCIVPHDWLLSFLAAYKRYPGAGGVGGYVRVSPEHYTIYDELQHYELAQRLGVEREKKFLTRIYEVCNQAFYQNPTGDLANISYLKEVIPTDLAGARNIYDLELHLKISAMRERPLVFIPKAVARDTPLSASEFLRIEFERGFLNRLARESIYALGKYRRQTLMAALAQAVRTTLRYRDMRYGALSFLASIARWVGNIGASHVRLRQRALREYLDRRREYVVPNSVIK
ncbi:CDP-glycerol glycerophosphotransferase family protein [Candidatus Kaiserbacteria bacterium]|nr:CDP-glycerol glycerophosphotransferase family protein [Candidatus Kaiserbacteria bacterium]